MSGTVNVEVIPIGKELLRGRTPDTNGPAIARFLSQRGAIVRRIVVVDDDIRSVTTALGESLGRNPRLVVTSGGLGPGLEDRTLDAVAEVLGAPLANHAGARAHVEEAYQRLRKRRILAKGGMTAAREKMCRLPVGAQLVPNRLGIAPGAICRLPGGTAVLCLPGLPDEMQAALEEAMPLLRDAAPRGHVANREIEAPTADESALQPMLDRLAHEYPGLWINSRPPDSHEPGSPSVIHLEAGGNSTRAANAAVDAAVKRLLALAAGSA